MTANPLALAIDTSGSLCAAGVFSGKDELARTVLDLGRGHSEKVIDTCAAALAEASARWVDLGLIAVTVGPGSFTGVRTGVAAARGLGLSLGIPARGVTTLESVALGVDVRSNPYAVALDARRGEVYLQSFKANGDPAAPPLLLSPENAVDTLPPGIVEIVGSGAVALVQAAAERGRAMHVGTRVGEPFAAGQPDIRDVLIAAVHRNRDAAPPEPLYLRKADAKAAPPPIATLESLA